MLNQLRGLVTLVTGGYSGLGLAVCQRLVQNGAKVVSLDLSVTLRPDVVDVKGDIRKEEDIERALEQCVDSNGVKRLDCVVNCAGVANAFQIYNFQTKSAQRLNDFRDLVDINISGTFNVTRLAVPLIANNAVNSSGCRGVIVNTSSILAFEGHEGQAGYGATQMAINSMTLPIARELASLGIRCNTIACGFFETPLVMRSDSPELLEFIKDATVLPKRVGRPEEFAALVQSIIENQMINGEIIRIDGGLRWPERD